MTVCTAGNMTVSMYSGQQDSQGVQRATGQSGCTEGNMTVCTVGNRTVSMYSGQHDRVYSGQHDSQYVQQAI